MCATLTTCCASLGGQETTACDMAASQNIQAECQAALSVFEEAGLCH
jgi:hypothetical protein